MVDLRAAVGRVLTSGLLSAPSGAGPQSFCLTAGNIAPQRLEDRILAAATSRLANRDLNGLALNAVAADVGITKRKLLESFPSRPILVGSALERALRPLQNAFEGPPGFESAASGLIRVITYLAYEAQAGWFFFDRRVLEEAPGDVGDRLAGDVVRVQQQLTRLIERAVNDGSVKPLRLASIAELCLGAVEGAHGLTLEEVAPYLRAFFCGPERVLQ